MLIFTIKNLRKQKNLTLNQLSCKCDLSTTYLSDIENNKLDSCSTKTLEKIATALNVNIKDLFYSKFDIEDLRQKLDESIEKNGLNSRETLEISQLIDLLINIINKEKET